MIIPWITINDPRQLAGVPYPSVPVTLDPVPLPFYIAYALPDWAEVTDTAIVASTSLFVLSLHEQVSDMAPRGLRIIPGCLAFSRDLTSMWDVDGWQRLIDEVIDPAAGDTFVLDMEDIFKAGRIESGAWSASVGQWMKSLELLAKSSKIIWWNLPRIMPDDPPDFPDRKFVTTAMLKLLHCIMPTAMVMDSSVGFVQTNDDARTAMATAVGGDEHLLDRMLVKPNGVPIGATIGAGVNTYFETDAAIIEAKTREPRTQIIWPGGANWTRVAREWREGV